MLLISAWIHLHGDLALAIFLLANALLTVFVILLENREPEKSIAWFLALLLFPFVGFVFYLFFGRDWHKRSYQQKRASMAFTAKRRTELAKLADRLSNLPPQERSLRLLDANLTGFDPTEGNQVHIFSGAQEKYARLFSAMHEATRTIDVEYYIFQNDDTGKQFVEILKERARAGINVRFLVDGMGSFGFGRKRFRDMREAGIACHYFSPLITLFYFLKANYRDHRKIVVVDDEIAFTGGINVGDEYLGHSRRGSWRDTSMELRGPCAVQFADLFEYAWRSSTGRGRRGARRVPAPLPGGELVDVVPSGPDGAWRAIHQHYLALVNGAEQRVRIQTPYFIPDESVQSSLISAALRGVEVQLMLPRKPDWPYLRLVAQTYLGELLRAGVRVYEYRAGFLHTKAFIVDDLRASVGTCNVDMRSFRLDFEVNVLLSGTASVRRLSEDFERDLTKCDELTYSQFIDRPFWRRVAGSIARLVSPLL